MLEHLSIILKNPLVKHHIFFFSLLRKLNLQIYFFEENISLINHKSMYKIYIKFTLNCM